MYILFLILEIFFLLVLEIYFPFGFRDKFSFGFLFWFSRYICFWFSRYIFYQRLLLFMIYFGFLDIFSINRLQKRFCQTHKLQQKGKGNADLNDSESTRNDKNDKNENISYINCAVIFSNRNKKNRLRKLVPDAGATFLVAEENYRR